MNTTKDAKFDNQADLKKTPQEVSVPKEESQEPKHKVARDTENALDEILKNYERAWKTLATRDT